jgi:hypothetical protein
VQHQSECPRLEESTTLRAWLNLPAAEYPCFGYNQCICESAAPASSVHRTFCYISFCLSSLQAAAVAVLAVMLCRPTVTNPSHSGTAVTVLRLHTLMAWPDTMCAASRCRISDRSRWAMLLWI